MTTQNNFASDVATDQDVDQLLDLVGTVGFNRVIDGLRKVAIIKKKRVRKTQTYLVPTFTKWEKLFAQTSKAGKQIVKRKNK